MRARRTGGPERRRNVDCGTHSVSSFCKMLGCVGVSVNIHTQSHGPILIFRVPTTSNHQQLLTFLRVDVFGWGDMSHDVKLCEFVVFFRFCQKNTRPNKKLNTREQLMLRCAIHNISFKMTNVYYDADLKFLNFQR